MAHAHFKAQLEAETVNLAEANTIAEGLLTKLAGEDPADPATIKGIRLAHRRCERRNTSLTGVLTSWREDIQHLKSGTNDRKAATEALELLATEAGGFPAALAKSKTLLAKMDDALDARGQLESDSESEVAKAPAEAAPLDLPEWKIPKFNGDPRNYLQWWEAFKACVHTQSIPDARKCYHLHASLEGDAKRAISGFSLTAANYPLALARIQSKWGDKQVLSAQLNNELLSMATPPNNVAALDQFSDEVERLLGQLTELGTDVNNDATSAVIKSKLPTGVRESLAMKEIESGETWDTTTLRTKLQAYVKVKRLVKGAGESISQDTRGSNPTSSGKKDKGRDQRRDKQNKPAVIDTRTFAAVVKGEPARKAYPCLFCDTTEHLSANCPKFPSAEQRRRRLDEKRLCSICLQAGHGTLDCTSGRVCSHCKGPHHYLVCSQRQTKKSPTSGQAFKGKRPQGTGKTKAVKPTGGNATPKGPTHTSASVASFKLADSSRPPTSVVAASQQGREILLMARHVDVLSERAHSAAKRALLFFDSGSELSYIKDTLAAELGLKRAAPCELLIEVFGGREPTRLSTHFYKATVVGEKGQEVIYLASTPRIVRSIKTLRWQGIYDLPQAGQVDDLVPTLSPEEPDILIGAGDWPRWVRDIKPLSSELLLCNTIVGPVVIGAAQRPLPFGNPHRHPLTLSAVGGDNSSESGPLADFWSLEALGISDDPNSQEEDSQAWDYFLATVKKGKDGHYVVSFPWREDLKPQLRDNYHLAFHRTAAILRRLAPKPELLRQYDSRVREYLDGDIIERSARNNGRDGVVEHFLAHHPVVVEKAPGVFKLRIVHDGSASTRDSFSLNECLMRGPQWVTDLGGLLLRLRLPTVAVLSDIEKAFLMVEIEEADREATKFLWPIDITKPFTPSNCAVYRFRRLAFGLVCSPFLLSAVLKYHLSAFETPIAREIEGNIYVDNVLLSADSSTEAVFKSKAAKAMLIKAKMNLREFISNSPQTMAALPERDRLGRTAPKVLGLIWDTERDFLSVPFPTPKRGEMLTNRQILSELASVFDPLGYASPCLLAAKLFSQELWGTSRSWDDPLTAEESAKWVEITQPWTNQSITVPRRMTPEASSQLQLHVFVDSSKVAYACAVYLRSQQQDGSVQTHLCYARNRLVPRKGMSIPRAELTAAWIGIKALEFVRTQLRQLIESEWFWGDSQAVLHWIANGGENQPRFIANRIANIRKIAKCEFRYVHTSENPADIPTRGRTPAELQSDSLWWHGPHWLSLPPSGWPTTVVVQRFSTVENTPVVNTTVVEDAEEPDQGHSALDPQRFSTWLNALNCFLWVARFISIQLNRAFPSGLKVSGPFTASDYEVAEANLLRMAQASMLRGIPIFLTHTPQPASTLWRSHREPHKPGTAEGECVVGVELTGKPRLILRSFPRSSLKG